jgi:DNA-binding beta-propeller fold protein YncE
VACAHAPPAALPLPEVTYPRPPAAPRARLARVLPDPNAPGSRPSFWRRLGRVLAGAEAHDDPQERLVRPFGLAAAADGTTYVADPDAGTVLRIDPAGALADVSCRKREWGAPMAVALDGAGALLVADAGAAEIVVVAADRSCRAIGRGALERPTGVTTTSDGRIVIADPPRHQLVVLAASGEVLARWGRHGEGDGELNFPSSVARAPDGTLLVVDALNFRIVRLAPDGAWLGAFGSAGTEDGGLGRPKAVAADEDGRVYVSDTFRDVVLVFGREGRFEYAIGETGTDPGAFTLPAGVAVQGGKLKVADSQNRRIQVFEILGGSS